jgi:membrane-associated protease RseP (regulator of RpoE activity)
LEPFTVVEWQPRPKFQDRIWLHVLLFALTIASTTWAGTDFWVSFLFSLGQPLPTTMSLSLVIHGLAFSLTVLTILGCHELGHYFACRYYDVDASLPFFLPVPPPFLTGTLGAFIRIREPIPQKRMLFDIGIGGPIAGFVVAVPLLIAGIAMSTMSPMLKPSDLPDGAYTYTLGYPLLFKAVSAVLWGTAPAGFELNLHPIAVGAWFGLLATALNLFPVGQLDGGHVAYSVLGPRWSTYLTFVMIAIGIGLGFLASSWFVWTGLMVAMLFAFGPRHPRVFDEDTPLDRTRMMLAVFAVVMFVLCFTLVPVTISELIRH